MANTHSASFVAASSQYLSITNASQIGLNFSTALTFETWVYLSSQPALNGTMALITKEGSTNNRGYAFYYDDNAGTKEIRIFMTKDGTVNSGSYDFFVWNYTLTLNTWTHIAFTWDGSTKTGILYINGTQNGTSQTGTNVASIFATTGDFQIAADTLYLGYFNGLLDEVRVWNVIRSSTDIANNYKTQISIATGLVGSWHFDTNLTTDSSGNSNTLTNNNVVTQSTNVPFGGITNAAFLLQMINN